MADGSEPAFANAGGAGLAEAVPGGYRLSGHWKVVSGINFANWFITFGMVTKDGEPRLTAGGASEVRLFAVHRDQLRIENIWNVSGMRATGSNDVVVADAFIPAMLVSSADFPSRIDRPLYRGFPPVLVFPGCAADALYESAATTGAVTINQRANLRAAMSHAANASRDALVAMYELAGSTAPIPQQQDRTPVPRRHGGTSTRQQLGGLPPGRRQDQPRSGHRTTSLYFE